MPTNDDSLTLIARSLSTLGRRDVQRQFLVETLRDASVDLSPGGAWLLGRLEENPLADFDQLASMAGVERGQMDEMVHELEAKGLIAADVPANGSSGYQLSASGKEAVVRIRAAVRQRLSDRLGGWSPEKYRELGKLLDSLTSDLVTEPQATI